MKKKTKFPLSTPSTLLFLLLFISPLSLSPPPLQSSNSANCCRRSSSITLSHRIFETSTPIELHSSPIVPLPSPEFVPSSFKKHNLLLLCHRLLDTRAVDAIRLDKKKLGHIFLHQARLRSHWGSIKISSRLDKPCVNYLIARLII